MRERSIHRKIIVKASKDKKCQRKVNVGYQKRFVGKESWDWNRETEAGEICEG